LGLKVKELEALVEKINIQHGDSTLPSDDFSKTLDDLSSKIAEIETYCDINLNKAQFLTELKASRLIFFIHFAKTLLRFLLLRQDFL
jgi:hypothetical protein